MVLAGALIAGQEVSNTVGKGLLKQQFFTPYVTCIILFSISLSLLVANLLGVPQSTSHTTVLSIAGAATALDGLNTKKLFYEIIPTWIILPIISFFIMLILSKWIIPWLKKHVFKKDFTQLKDHPGLKVLLILSSLYVAFSIGANNVANVAAPIASLTTNAIGLEKVFNSLPVITLCVLIVAPFFALGSAILGHKGTNKSGKHIVEVDVFHATIIAILVATLLLLAAVAKGIPTSLVQLNAGAFIALSITKNGFKNTFTNKTVIQFFTIWGIAPVFAFVLTYLLILLL
jgi:phosphate/sulfate permease